MKYKLSEAYPADDNTWIVYIVDAETDTVSTRGAGRGNTPEEATQAALSQIPGMKGRVGAKTNDNEATTLTKCLVYILTFIAAIIASIPFGPLFGVAVLIAVPLMIRSSNEMEVEKYNEN